MDIIRFEWDENKNAINKRKHAISFEEAQTVFYDEEALVIDDPEHSEQHTGKFVGGLPLLPSVGNRYPHYLGEKSDQERSKAV